jgi:hypothetical protein
MPSARPCSNQGRTFDAELLYIAVMLHDLGLTDEFEDGFTPFEQSGANAARRACRPRGGPGDRRTGPRGDRPPPGGHRRRRPAPRGGRRAGRCRVDVLGLRLADLPSDRVAHILGEYPRLNFKAMFFEAVARQVRLEPRSRIARHLERHDIAGLVVAVPIDS